MVCVQHELCLVSYYLNHLGRGVELDTEVWVVLFVPSDVFVEEQIISMRLQS